MTMLQLITDNYQMEFYFARMYRLNSHRKFGNIFSAQNNGCPYLQAGIGNISFVKDLMTRTVVSNNFTCSKFGPNTHHGLGWVECSKSHSILYCKIPSEYICVVVFMKGFSWPYLSFTIFNVGKDELLSSE